MEQPVGCHFILKIPNKTNADYGEDMTFDQKTLILAIIIIGGLEGIALYKGIDGKGLSVAIAAIAGLAGYKIRDLWPTKKS